MRWISRILRRKKKFTAVAAAVNEGVTQGIREFVPKKSRSIRGNVREQA